jgi:hypothetical protein
LGAHNCVQGDITPTPLNKIKSGGASFYSFSKQLNDSQPQISDPTALETLIQDEIPQDPSIIKDACTMNVLNFNKMREELSKLFEGGEQRSHNLGNEISSIVNQNHFLPRSKDDSTNYDRNVEYRAIMRS